MNPISDKLVQALCWTLLHSLWQGLLLAVVAGIIMVLSRKMSSALRYNLLCGLMVLFTGVIVCTFFRELSLDALENASKAALTGAPAGLSVDGPAGIGGIADATGSAWRDDIHLFVQYFNTHASLVTLLWFIFFIGRSVRMAGELVYVQRIRYYQTGAVTAVWEEKFRELVRRLKIGQPVGLLESSLVKVPAVVGYLKPVILIPMGMLTRLSPEQVESILIHELAHIRRKDYLFNLIQGLVDTVFFFNPALIWVSSLIRNERENCCDDIAIRETGSRRQFVEALVSFHQHNDTRQRFAMSLAGQENRLVRRVRRIVHKKNPSLQTGERLLLIVGMMVLGTAFMTVGNGRASLRNVHTSWTVPSETRMPETRILATIPVRKISPNRPQTMEMQPMVVRSATTSSTVKRRVTWQRMGTPAKDTVVVPARGSAANPPSQATQPSQSSQPHAVHPVLIPADRWNECRDHGVTEEYIRSFEEMGYQDITLDRSIQLKDHGVSTEFIRRFVQIGYSGISIEMALKLRDHGVTAGYIEGFREIGFKDLSLEEAIRLRDHGVSAEFIQAWRTKTGATLDLDDYIHLRDARINPK